MLCITVTSVQNVFHQYFVKRATVTPESSLLWIGKHPSWLQGENLQHVVSCTVFISAN